WPDSAGSYEASVTDLGASAGDDHGNACGAATAIAADGSVTSIIIDPGTDEDWLSLAADAGHRYEFTTFRTSGAFYALLALIDTDCATVLRAWDYGTQDEWGFFAPATATYYLRITSSFGGNPGYVGLGVTDRGAQTDDYSGYQSGATAAPTNGTVVNGT